MAAYMKAHPGSFPDSVRRPWNGVGSADRDLAMKMGRVPNGGSTWDKGMLGGIIAARLGFGSYGVPAELLPVRRVA